MTTLLKPILSSFEKVLSEGAYNEFYQTIALDLMKATNLLSSKPTVEQYVAAISHAAAIPRVKKYDADLAPVLLETLLDLFKSKSQTASRKKQRQSNSKTEDVVNTAKVRNLNSDSFPNANHRRIAAANDSTMATRVPMLIKKTKPTYPVVQDYASTYNGCLAACRDISDKTRAAYTKIARNIESSEPKSLYKYCTLRDCRKCMNIFKYVPLTKCSHKAGEKCNVLGLYPHVPRCTWKKLHANEAVKFPKLVCFARHYFNPMCDLPRGDDQTDMEVERPATSLSSQPNDANPARGEKRSLAQNSPALNRLKRLTIEGQLTYCCPCGSKLKKNARGNRNCSVPNCASWLSYKQSL